MFIRKISISTCHLHRYGSNVLDQSSDLYQIHQYHVPPLLFSLLQGFGGATDRFPTGKTQDHDGLVGEHVIYTYYTLVPVVAHIFNRAMCEGFYTSWAELTIVLIFKIGHPTKPSKQS